MDSICILQFWNGLCPSKGACPHAHRLADLCNAAHWVLFQAPELQMLDFLPYRLQSHHYFQAFPLRGTGPLVRFATAEDALTVVRDFQEYYSPRYLPDVLARPLAAPALPVVGALDDAQEAAPGLLTRRAPKGRPAPVVGRGSVGSVSSDDLSSAYLNCLIKEHESTPQVCLYFLAGLCTHGDGCRYLHPVGTAGWTSLRTRWGVTYQDFDYAVLNYLSKKPVAQQDEILSLFAEMNLRAVKNRSAYLSSMIERYERVGLRKRSRARVPKIIRPNAEAATGA
jgi:hypothetical protein